MKEYHDGEALEYLTEDELELLIEDIEGHRPYAPRHMKEQIIQQVLPQETGSVPTRSKSVSTVGSLAYRFKIVAGMAAAVVMAVLLPWVHIFLGMQEKGEDISYAVLIQEKEEQNRIEREQELWQREAKQRKELPNIWQDEEDAVPEEETGLDHKLDQKTKQINEQLGALLQQINSLLS